MRLREISDKIVQEITSMQEGIDEEEVLSLIQAILQARWIVVHGAGRMGLMARAFAMRLAHLGFQAYVLGESTTPAVGPDDLLIIASGSGETKTVVEVVKIGKSRGVRLATITCQPASTIGQMADIVVCMPEGLAEDKSAAGLIQPMKTTIEQNLLILLDAIVILIMEETRQTSQDLWDRHSNLE